MDWKWLIAFFLLEKKNWRFCRKPAFKNCSQCNLSYPKNLKTKVIPSNEIGMNYEMIFKAIKRFENSYVAWLSLECTDSTKINRLEYNIRMYWTNFRQPTAHVKTLLEVYSLHLYASFDTFCVQIGQLLAPQWVFKHSEEFRNRRHFPSKTGNCRFSNIL